MTEDSFQVQIEFEDDAVAMRVLGVHDRHLKQLRDYFQVEIQVRDQRMTISGEESAVKDTEHLVREIIEVARDENRSVSDFVESALEGPAVEPARDMAAVARSKGQNTYLHAMQAAEVVFAIGPAGTGKTYLAVLQAVEALKAGVVRKLVLCRPAVEAGEKLGFLPGDFQAKINPYLRPLYDALNELLDYDQVRRYTDREIIEIVPLAYMRGRTLNRSFIILDEGQNTTPAQMKMFLTRMGQGSRIVVTGDVTQVDLPHGTPSGLIQARRILQEIGGIRWVELGRKDIVRHSLVSEIVLAYERHEGVPPTGSRKPKQR